MKTSVEFSQKIFTYKPDFGKIRLLFRILAVSLAIVHTWAAIVSQSMNEDGITYLDIGDAYFRADWENAINPVWSPIYPLILGMTNMLIKPSMQWEFSIVHILNFFIFIAALICFEYMWHKVQLSKSINSISGFIKLPDWAWWSLGYSLFILVTLNLIQVWAVTPDMLMAAFVLIAGGLIAQIRNGDHSWKMFLSLGVVLGFGYLTKTFMFTVALVFLGVAAFMVLRARISPVKPLIAIGLFLLISLPFIFLISEKKGKFTIGEAGPVTYMRYVNGIPYPHWQGSTENKLTHPSRLIYQSPRVYEFGKPIGGTYPISFDPSYWYDGIEIRFHLQNQLRRILASGLFYLDLFLEKQGLLIASVLALYAMRQSHRLALLEIIKGWALVIPALIAFGLYGLVLVSGRYVGVFLLLFWADILVNVRIPDIGQNKIWINVLSAIAVIGLLGSILAFNLEGFNRLNTSTISATTEKITAPPASSDEVVQALQQLGIGQGDKVAIIGYGFDSFWARLARVRIVSEMLISQADDFWLGEASLQRDVLNAFESTGAKAVIAEEAPSYARLIGWHRVGKSNYYIYLFDE